MNYYDRPEVSNSTLSWFRDQLRESEYRETEDVYRMGNLLDHMITEPEKVNFFTYTCNGEQCTPEEFEMARQMKKAFFKDDFCKKLMDAGPEFQKVMIKEITFNHEIPFSLPVRCKWDFYFDQLGFGGDIKTTTATSQEQFTQAARFFDYDRQRYFYMELAGSDKDMIIGISKVNYQVFKIPIRRGDDFWQSGRDKCLYLAFRYWLMFGNNL